MQVTPTELWPVILKRFNQQAKAIYSCPFSLVKNCFQLLFRETILGVDCAAGCKASIALPKPFRGRVIRHGNLLSLGTTVRVLGAEEIAVTETTRRKARGNGDLIQYVLRLKTLIYGPTINVSKYLSTRHWIRFETSFLRRPDGQPEMRGRIRHWKAPLGPAHAILLSPIRAKPIPASLKRLATRCDNSVADEEDITNFRVISDYMTSLMQSWIANRDFFIVSPDRIAFFGTQLVLIGRQFGSVADTVNEVRFALDSVFIGRNERQSLLLKFRDAALPGMFLEDMLVEIESFVTDEGPRLLRDGGKISVKNNILPVVRSYLRLVRQAHDPENKYKVPDGFRTARVRRTLDDLQDQLSDLVQLIEQVEGELPTVTDKLQVISVRPTRSKRHKVHVSIFGGGFNPQSVVTMRQGSNALTIVEPEFYSDQRIDVTLELTGTTTLGHYDVEVRNSTDEYVVVSDGFTVTKD